MGKILVFLKYMFLVFGNDVNERRKHIHVSDANFTKLCKFWIEKEIEVKGKLVAVPEISLCSNKGFSNKELTEIEAKIKENIDYVTEQLNNFYNGKSIKIKKVNK